MPQVDLSKTTEASANQYPPLPDGWYAVRLQQVFERKSPKVGDYYGLEFVVTMGSYSGRKIFDSMFFTDDAKPRLKLILKRLGFDVDGMVMFTPADLLNRECKIQVITESVTYKGVTKDQNKVEFAGYDYIDAPEKVEVEADGNPPLPF